MLLLAQMSARVKKLTRFHVQLLLAKMSALAAEVSISGLTDVSEFFWFPDCTKFLKTPCTNEVSWQVYDP